MRFRLVEAPERQWPPTVDTINAYNNLDTDVKKENFLDTYILPQPKFRKLIGIRPIIKDCILRFGIDPKRNIFLNFITKLSVDMPSSKPYKQNMQYIYDSFRSKKITVAFLGNRIFQNPSLYNRNYKDFQYTLKVFDMFSDPKRVAAYLKDTKKVDIAEFMDGNEIKPAGMDGRDGDTIYNVIEMWSKDNEYSAEEIASNKEELEKEKEQNDGKKPNDQGTKYVLEDVIDKETWNYNTFKKYITNAFKHKGDLKISSTKEECLEKLYIAFEYPKIIEPNTLKEIQNTPNKVNNKTPETITESDVKVFGDPTNKPDEPIYVKLISDGTTNDGVSGIFIFHKFIPLTKENINNMKQQSASYLRDMELKSFIGTNDHMLDKLQGIITIIEQIG